ncbi:MAG: non-homologous end-joining DNA ligase [Actinobacteria bacterium]|nr:non-homologous end-joining DNA ligase [Actinomycetota bacterium]
MLPKPFTPMMATLGEKPFDSPDHLFEVKWDGVRTLAFCEGGRTRLFARSGREVTHQYHEFSDLHTRLKVKEAVFDGEIVAMDERGRPSFERLQSRINLQRDTDIRRGIATVPLELVIFDLVFADSEWIGELPLVQRIEQLPSSINFGEGVLHSEGIPDQGTALFEAAKEKGLEGIVAKKTQSIYVPGRRTKDWIKIKVTKRASVVIGGLSPGEGSRGSSFGSLMVGAFSEDGLQYLGNVGTGFTDRTLGVLISKLAELESAKSPFMETPRIKGVRWVKPTLVAEVEYRELTNALRLRAPSFKGLRDDITPEQCRLEDVA